MNDDETGLKLLKIRNNFSIKMIEDITLIKIKNIDFSKKFIISGIGSSKSHAFYLLFFFKNNNINCEFIELSAFDNYNGKGKNLILFSQGLSPNGTIPINCNFDHLTLFTSVTFKNKNNDKINILKKADYIINFPLEDEYTTLIRIVGPLIGYNSIIKFCIHEGLFENINYNIDFNKINLKKHVDFICKFKPQIKIITNDYFKTFCQNIQYKFMEGIFYPSIPDICDYLEFSHGHIQNLLTNEKNNIKTMIIILNNSNNKYSNNLKKSIDDKLYVWEIKPNYGIKNIIYYEWIFNQLILEIITRWEIDQVTWEGFNNINLYNITS